MTAIVGNPQSGSRTLGVATSLAERAAEAVGGTATVLDLATVAVEVVQGSEVAHALVAESCAADVVLVCSPTYKATFTGLLKCFFDLAPYRALAGRVAVPVMTGASPVHTLATEVHLRPLLLELGASTPTGSLFVTTDRLPDLDGVLDEWMQVNGPWIRGLRSVAGSAPSA